MAEILINTVGGYPDPLAIVHGGTGLSGTATLTAGTGIAITGTWPNQTVATSGMGAGTVTSITAGTGIALTPSTITSTGSVGIANTGVSAGNYTNANITINDSGQITAASAGAAGTGTVTSVATQSGLTGGTITTAGSLGLANIATNTLLANTSSSTALPVATTVTAMVDTIGATQGDVLYRNSTQWVALTTGTSGQFLATQGAAANPVWASAATGTVTSVALTAPTFLSVTGSPITTTGTIAVTLTTQASNIVFAGPSSGAAVAPTFRALVSADMPAGTGTVTSLTAGSGITLTPSTITSSGAIAVQTTGVTAGSFTNANITVNAQGQLTAAANGSAPGTGTVTSVAGQSGLTGSVTTAGSLGLANIATMTLLANTSTGTALPLAITMSSAIDSMIASTQGDVLYRGTTSWAGLATGTSGQALVTQGASANPLWATVATVSSVAVTMPSIFSVTGSPVTTTGTIAVTLTTEHSNLVFAGPSSGVDATPTFRSLVAADIPAGYALLATQNAFTSSQGGPAGALTDGTTISWDASSIQIATLAINGNRTLSNPTNLTVKTYALIVTQGSGGSHTLAYGSAFLWAGGSGNAFVLSTASGAVDVVTWISDGTHMMGVGQKAFA